MKQLFTKSALAIFTACTLSLSVSAQTDGTPGVFTSEAGNSYLYYQYGDLYWMVSNSREGDPKYKTYHAEGEDSKAEGENGYYYYAGEKEQACPEGWRLPTREEADKLIEYILKDETAEDVRWWNRAEDNAFAGAIRDEKATAWGIYGIWRLANGTNTATGDENWPHFTMTIDPSKGKCYTDTGSKKGLGYSVRCVKSVNDTGLDKVQGRLDAYFSGNNIVVVGLEAQDLGASIIVFDIQGIELIRIPVNAVQRYTIPVNLSQGTYIVALTGTRNLTVKIQK